MLLPVSIRSTVGRNDHLRGLYGVADFKKCAGGGNWRSMKLQNKSVDGKFLLEFLKRSLPLVCSVETPHRPEHGAAASHAEL